LAQLVSARTKVENATLELHTLAPTLQAAVDKTEKLHVTLRSGSTVSLDAIIRDKIGALFKVLQEKNKDNEFKEYDQLPGLLEVLSTALRIWPQAELFCNMGKRVGALVADASHNKLWCNLEVMMQATRLPESGFDLQKIQDMSGKLVDYEGNTPNDEVSAEIKAWTRDLARHLSIISPEGTGVCEALRFVAKMVPDGDQNQNVVAQILALHEAWGSHLAFTALGDDLSQLWKNDVGYKMTKTTLQKIMMLNKTWLMGSQHGRKSLRHQCALTT
jgi:hypothetical protein